MAGQQVDDDAAVDLSPSLAQAHVVEIVFPGLPFEPAQLIRYRRPLHLE